MIEYPVIDSQTVAQKLRKFGKQFKKFRARLESYYGEQVAVEIEKKTRAFYERMLPETPVFDGSMNLFNTIILGNVLLVAFHKAMRDAEKPVEHSVRIAYEVYDEMHRSIPRPIVWGLKHALTSSMFRSFANHSSRLVKDHPAGWTIEYGGGDTDDLHFTCTRCGVIEYYRRNDVMELAPYCNLIDYIQGRTFGLGLVNPRNIGQGSEDCFESMKLGRETPVPENLREILEYKIEA